MFETLRVREGRIPFLREHRERLDAAARHAGLGVATGLTDRLLARTRGADGVVRVAVSPEGESITTRPLPTLPLFNLRLSTVSHQPYPFKSTDRALFDDARAEALARGAHEALLLTRDGFLAEGAITSVAFWRDEAVCVPELGLGILPGVGRARLLVVAREQGIDVVEGCFSRAAWEGRALLLVNAVRGVIEVAALDGVALPLRVETTGLWEGFWPRG